MDPTQDTLGEQGVIGTRVGRRMLLLFTGCALSPLLAFGAFTMSEVPLQLRESSQRTLHHDTKSAGMEIAGRLLALTDTLSLARDLCAADSRALHTVEATAIRARLAELDAFVGLQIGDDLQPLLGTGAERLELAEHESSHLDGAPWLVRAIVSGSRPRLQFASKTSNHAGAALFVASIDSARVLQLDTLRGSGSDVTVLNSRLEVVIHSGPTPEPRLLRAAVALEPSSSTFDWSDRGDAQIAHYWLVFLRPQLGNDWLVVQSMPLSRAVEALRGFQTTFVLTAILTLLLVAFASLTQIRRLLRPIQSLIATMRKVRNGELDARSHLTGVDEFGELGRSFDAMTETLVDNIHRREATERDLVTARDAALDSARTKAAFLTNVSHELRTPLTSIASAGEILRSFCDDEDPAVRAEFTDIVLDQADHLRRLIDGVLQLNGETQAQLAPMALQSSLHEAIRALPGEAQSRVHITLPRNLPRIQGDAVLLQRLWSQLLGNAVKFSAPETPIDVRATSGEDLCMIEIEDRGIGIPADQIDHIFAPFHQGNRDIMTDKAAGFGLGLSIANDIVQRHGGRIDVRSEVGKGSTFRVVLPTAVATTRGQLASVT